MKTGIQISSFKPLMKDKDGLARVLDAMKAMGCKYTQLQWIDKSISAETISEMLRERGIVSVGTQEKAKELFADAEYFAVLNKAAASDDLCISGVPIEYTFEEYFSEVKRVEKLGVSLSYHPTNTDFANDCERLEWLLAQMPKMRLCADVCQIRDAGLSPSAFIKKHAGRIDIVHFKDRDENGDLCVVGEGVTDFVSAAKACKEAGVKYVLAEQETWKGDAIESLRKGFEFVESLF